MGVLIHNPLLQHSSHPGYQKAYENIPVCDQGRVSHVQGKNVKLTQQKDGEICQSMEKIKDSFLCSSRLPVIQGSSEVARHDKTI